MGTCRGCAQPSAGRIGRSCRITRRGSVLGIAEGCVVTAEQTELSASFDGLTTGVDFQLVKDPRDMGVDRAAAEKEGLGNLAIGARVRHKLQYPDLPQRQMGRSMSVLGERFRLVRADDHAGLGDNAFYGEGMACRSCFVEPHLTERRRQRGNHPVVDGSIAWCERYPDAAGNRFGRSE